MARVGTPAGQATRPAGVPPETLVEVTALPVKVGAETLPAGVTESAPPVPVTSPFPASVPSTNFPDRLVSSVKPLGHVVRLNMIEPAGNVLALLT
jgi:hypothetical protein